MNIKYEKVITFILEFDEEEFAMLIGALEVFEQSSEKNQENGKTLDKIKNMKKSMIGKYREIVEYRI